MKYLLRYDTLMTKGRANALIFTAIVFTVQHRVANFIVVDLKRTKTYAREFLIYCTVFASIVGILYVLLLLLYLWTLILVKQQVANTGFAQNCGQIAVNIHNGLDGETDEQVKPRPGALTRRVNDVTKAIVCIIVAVLLLSYPDICMNIAIVWYSFLANEADVAVMKTASIIALCYTRPAFILNCSVNAILLIVFCRDVKQYACNFLSTIRMKLRL